MNYHPLVKHDALIVLRGFLLLASIILIGVGVAQHQLVNLTQKNQPMDFLALKTNNSYRHSDHFLGTGKHFNYLYHLGEIGQKEGFLIFKTAGRQMTVPVHFHFIINIEQIKSQVKPFYEYFQQLAYSFKNYIHKEWQAVIHYLPVFK